MTRGALRAVSTALCTVLGGLTVTLSGCGSAQSKPPALASSTDEPAPATANPAPEPGSDTAAPVSENPPPEASETTPPPASEPELSAAELCQKMCDRVK